MHEIRYSKEFNKDYVKLREKTDKGNSVPAGNYQQGDSQARGKH